MRVDRLVKEMERVRRPTLEKDIDIVLLTGLSSQYDAEVLMLESSADWPDCAWIERVLCNQYDRIRRENSEAGPKHPLVVWYRLLKYASSERRRGTPRRTPGSWSTPNANRSGMASAAAGDNEAAKLVKMARRPQTEASRS